MSKRFVIGDIHGRVKALKEVLRLSNFNYEEDKLILLGDIVDGGYHTYEVVEELLKINNLVFVLGNHDEWFMNHIKTGWAKNIWVRQGGEETIKSYGGRMIPVPRDSMHPMDTLVDHANIDTRDLNIPVTHQDFFNRATLYHIEDNMLFVHGGFDPEKGIEETSRHVMLWDRDLIWYAKNNVIKQFDKVFIGHTTTQSEGSDVEGQNIMRPVWFNNLCMMDCGAGYDGKLAMMNIDTGDFYLSTAQEVAGR